MHVHQKAQGGYVVQWGEECFVFCDILQCDTPQCWGPVEWKQKYKITKHHPEYCCICSKTLNTHDTNKLSSLTEHSRRNHPMPRYIWVLLILYSKLFHIVIQIVAEKRNPSSLWNAFAIKCGNTFKFNVHGHNVQKNCTRDFRALRASNQSTCISGHLRSCVRFD